MHDRVIVEGDRMRAALRSRHYRAALRICRRIAALLDDRADELSTRSTGAANGRRRRGTRRPIDTVPMSLIAHEIGVDLRTLRHYIERLPFVTHPAPRVWLVHRPSWAEWYEKNGRRLR